MSFQAYLDNIQTKTGKSPSDFKKLAEKKGIDLTRQVKARGKSRGYSEVVEI